MQHFSLDFTSLDYFYFRIVTILHFIIIYIFTLVLLL